MILLVQEQPEYLIAERNDIPTQYTAYKKTPWLESASELYRPSDRRLSAKLVPTLAIRGCRVVSATIPPQSF
jgi:hypothetical protein